MAFSIKRSWLRQKLLKTSKMTLCASIVFYLHSMISLRAYDGRLLSKIYSSRNRAEVSAGDSVSEDVFFSGCSFCSFSQARALRPLDIMSFMSVDVSSCLGALTEKVDLVSTLSKYLPCQLTPLSPCISGLRKKNVANHPSRDGFLPRPL
jgi:hypothetical protein